MQRPAGFLLAAVMLACASIPAAAQTPPASGQPPSQTQATTAPPAQGSDTSSGDRRPATTTFFGDTGLWFVPTAEILPNGKWSVSGYRAGFNREEGFTNIAHFAATFGVGLGDRAELFGSWRVITRIDRDVRPLFYTPCIACNTLAVGNPQSGGLTNEYPYVHSGWTGNERGDLIVGAKVNLLSEFRQSPAALAVRGMLKLPTGNRDAGVSTGKTDLMLDAIVSKDVGQTVELSGFGGFVWRGKPDTPTSVAVSNGFRWGVGAGIPSRSPLRLTAELWGERLSNDTITTSAPLVADDGSLSPLSNGLRNVAVASLGLTWQARSGFFAGGGINYNFLGASRDSFAAAFEGSGEGSRLRDYADFQVRIGYHPGVRVYVAPPPPPPPPPAPPANRPPTVKARCEPCTVEVGKSSTVTADAQDPDGDTLTYRWSAPSGTFANPGERQTQWTAPNQEGPVPVTVTVDDGKGGTASDNVTIQVVRPPQKTYVFEDVHFDFDRYSLRADATRVLDEAVAALKENPNLRVQIEGHTCNIGTAEYNLALGERRANSVRDYLVSRGVSADRLSTVSYGEERPKYDNDREETRRMNRRAALTVRITQ